MKFVFILLLLCSANAFSKTIYVSQVAIGSNDGSSWRNAFVDLQDALAAASSGDSIKVSAGVYLPTSSSAQQISFVIRRGTVMLGGYPAAGNDTIDSKRDWVNYSTILSGQLINGPQTTSLLHAQDIDTATLVDGFLVRNGNGNGHGAGIHVLNSVHLTIRNLVFEQLNDPGIMIINSSPVFMNCAMTNIAGKAIYNTANSHATFYNCIISDNIVGGTSEYKIVNENANISIINSAIVNNTGIGFYGTGSGAATIKNSIFWNNINQQGAFESRDLAMLNQKIVIDHCITQTYYEEGNNTLLVNINPRFVNIKNPAGPDNKFFTADDGLQLTVPCSPALNTGDNDASLNIVTDIAGDSRRYNGGPVDIGPYEKQETPGPVRNTVFVNNSVLNTGNGDGSSWQNAYKTLQEALLYCSDTIKVAAGEYLVSNSNTGNVFTIENRKIILGGYPSTGSQTNADRNPSEHRTVLKGNYTGGNAGVSGPVLKSYHNDSTTVIDGLSFNNLPVSGSLIFPALSISYASKLRVINCDFKISAVNSVQSSGIVISKSSSPFIYRSAFNTYMSDEGGIALYCSEGANPTISFCNFEGNKTMSRGNTAIAFSNAFGTIDSCIFWYKAKNSFGLTVSIDNSTVVINNCLFRGNPLGTNRLLASSNNSNSFISNSVFRSNDTFNSLAAIYNNNSSTVFTRCLFDSATVAVENVNRSAPVFDNCVSVNSRFMNNKLSFPVLNNCTIVNTFRSAVVGSAASEMELITNDDSTVLRANNTIFWSNRPAVGNKDINDRLSGTPARNSKSILNNCLTQTYGTNGVSGNIVGSNPRFFLLEDVDGPDNKMFTSDDGIMLATCSPAANSGSNLLSKMSTVDVLGRTRIVNSIVDMGAYELQQNTSTANSFYVNSTAGGSNSGTSWQNAYNQLQQALCNACADTIRVAAGIYKPALSNRDSSFYINRPLVVLGGYPASGNINDSIRNPYAYSTTLSGNIGNLEDSLDNSKTVMVIDAVKDSVVLDGLIIRDGYSRRGGVAVNAAFGAGVYTYYNHTNIKDCQFINNNGYVYGGGLAIGSRASSYVYNSLFSGNSASNHAGALVLIGNQLNVGNCVFENNSTFGHGGAIGIRPDQTGVGGIQFTAWNSVFYNNRTTGPNENSYGGAVYAAAGGGGITNCTFVENKIVSTFGSGGAGLYTGENFGMPIRNCIFWNNRAGGVASTAGTDLDWKGIYNLVFNCLLQNERNFVTTLNLYGVSPLFKDLLNPAGKDNKWFTSDDGLQPAFNSPAINYGANAVVANIAFDILGNARISQSTVDAGAYEYQNGLSANAGRDTIICRGTGIQIGGQGIPSHSYSWTSSPAGFTSALPAPTVAPDVNTTYFLEVTKGDTVARDTVIITVTNNLTPSVNITTPSTIICEGSAVTFSAIAVNAGNSAAWQWQVNGLNTGTNNPVFTATGLKDASQVQVVLTATGSCVSKQPVTSNVITLSFTVAATPAVSIVASATTICSGSVVMFTAVPVNGGSSPSYQWQKNGANIGTNNSVLSTSLLSPGDVVRVILTSSLACKTSDSVSSNQLSIIVTPAVSPTITISGNTTVVIGQSALLTANITNGGSTPMYNWQDSTATHDWQNITAATTSVLNYLPISIGVKVRCIVTTSASCASSLSARSNTLEFSLTVATGVINVPASSYAIIHYPNPVHAFLSIDNLRPGDQWQMLIVASIKGQRVMMQEDIRNKTKFDLDATKLSPGIYIALLKGKSGKTTFFKFLKM